MKIFETKKALKNQINSLKNQDISIGFVPTMGALHQGHLALVKASLQNNGQTVVSIFINPTQFNNQEDLIKYPKTIAKDLQLLKSLSNDIIIYHPDAQDFYNGKIESQHFDFDGLELVMEGKQRPGHFDGVGTVVKKLFEIVTPDRAYFGEKDFQQLQIIKKLVDKEQMPIQIIPVPIYRELDGLAMSSRNTRLFPEHRGIAPFIYETLREAKALFKNNSIEDVKNYVYRKMEENPLLKMEYFEIADEKTLKPTDEKISGNKYRGFIVVYAGDVRLIDNIAL